MLARFRRLGDALMPIAIAANAIPIIAFSPIFNAWFDPLSPAPRMATAAVLCFFPVMVNTLRGLTSVRPSQIELMRSYAAGEFAIFRRVRVPTALPFVFSALKVATVLAMIGAIVSDYFGTFGSLGITIKNSVSLFDFETAWAAILIASILGVAHVRRRRDSPNDTSSSGIQPVRKGELHEGEDTPRAARARRSSLLRRPRRSACRAQTRHRSSPR